MQDQPNLGRIERQALLLIWRFGNATAEIVRANLARPLKESTVRTVLRRLEQKGYITHTVVKRTYVYRAAAPRQQVTARAVKRIVDWFCNGSVEELLVCMVDTAVLDRKQLIELAGKITKQKKEAT
jgi:BlaI family transcriptional regulator, penicillinase repressor